MRIETSRFLLIPGKQMDYNEWLNTNPVVTSPSMFSEVSQWIGENALALPLMVGKNGKKDPAETCLNMLATSGSVDSGRRRHAGIGMMSAVNVSSTVFFFFPFFCSRGSSIPRRDVHAQVGCCHTMVSRRLGRPPHSQQSEPGLAPAHHQRVHSLRN